MKADAVKQGLFHQMLRYGLVGGVVYVSDFATYAAILWGLPRAYLAANIVGKAVGALVGFVLHKYFTFSWEQKAGAGQQALSYAALFGVNIATSSALLWLLVGQAGVNAYLVKPFIDGVVIATSFVAGRLWIYRPA
jgi:putative flippase GtrA